MRDADESVSELSRNLEKGSKGLTHRQGFELNLPRARHYFTYASPRSLQPIDFTAPYKIFNSALNKYAALQTHDGLARGYERPFFFRFNDSTFQRFNARS
jgi:hypothetical protein